MPRPSSDSLTVELPNALKAWGSDDFNDALRADIERLSHHQLPLQQALQLSSQVSDEPFQAMILGSEATDETVRVRASVFFSGVIAGCSCADDPTPLDLVNEHCTIEIRLDRKQASASLRLLPGD